MDDILKRLGCAALEKAPPLDPAWLAFEETRRKQSPPQQFASILDRQPVYAQECRELLARMTAPGARDDALLQGIQRTDFTVPSSVDGFAIPVMRLDLVESKQNGETEVDIIYYHGGGLFVGEADSEELSCRRLLKSMGNRSARLYSVGYRLMPTYPASTCLSDSLDAFQALHSKIAKTIIVGSSSGGQLAASIAQTLPPGSIHGVLLRGPVTSDPAEDKRYIPAPLRPFFTSLDESFVSSLHGYLTRAIPRDGLDRLPIEASRAQLEGHAPTWIQLCTNDTLYSDGLCYGMALVEAGVDVKVDVQYGWPHTFWLKAPELEQALRAEEAMVDGLGWLLNEK